MLRYLEPLQLVRESTKKLGTVFLGLSFSDEYVSLAISDHGYLTSPFFCKCPRDENLLDYLIDYIQTLQKDFGYHLEGIIVADVSFHNLMDSLCIMDSLCKKGKFEISYTFWEHNLTYSTTKTFYSAQHMLQAFLHHYNTLLCYEGEEREDSKREEEWCKIWYSELFLGLIFSDEYVELVVSDRHNPEINKLPIDDSLLDELVDVVRRHKGDDGYDLEGIIVAYSSSKDPPLLNIDNLMDGLCKKGMSGSLKYTFLERNCSLGAFLGFFDDLPMEDLMRKMQFSSLEFKYQKPFLFREYTVQYLEPLQLFRECMKRNYHMPSSIFIGLSFDDDYVSLAMSDDCYLTARFYNMYPRNDSLSDKLVEFVRRLIKELEYDLEGIIVAYSSSTAPPEKICNLMEGLCQKGNLASLKYTFWEDDIASEAHWEDDIASEDVEFEFNEFGSLFGGITTVKPKIQHAWEKMYSAQNMLDAFLHSFNTLHRDIDWDFEREKRCKICHSGAEHKMVKYLEPWQLFRESMKMTFYMLPAVFLGLSISDKIVSLAMSDSLHSSACHYGIFPIDDKSLLDKLLDSVLRVKIDCQYDLLGIVVANRSSKENPLSLEIDDLMDRLCKKGRFKSLKYTRWGDDIASMSALECYGSRWKAFPVDGSNVDGSKVSSEQQQDLEISSAQFMLGAYLNVFKTLHGDKYLRKKTRRGRIRRGQIPREKDAVQDAPQQSRAQEAVQDNPVMVL